MDYLDFGKIACLIDAVASKAPDYLLTTCALTIRGAGPRSVDDP